MKQHKFDEFTVYHSNDNERYSIIYANFTEADKFIEGLVEYIFSEQNLLFYTENLTGIDFNPGDKEYVHLYKNISYFLNDELEKIPMTNIDEDLKKILSDEYDCIEEQGKFIVQNDKIGKIGEYVFHSLLSKYFQYRCIIPKFTLTTNRNMSVFGIDALFYDQDNSEILFGESKFSNSIDNGIELINVSLLNYEHQIAEEFLLILSNSFLQLDSQFMKSYGDSIELCCSFDQFAKMEGIQSVVIPVFIAHGGEIDTDIEKILNAFDKIKIKKIAGFNTKYLFISLPVIDKRIFVEYAIRLAVKKQDEYRRKIPSN